jgi:hypothetical protein
MIVASAAHMLCSCGKTQVSANRRRVWPKLPAFSEEPLSPDMIAEHRGRHPGEHRDPRLGPALQRLEVEVLQVAADDRGVGHAGEVQRLEGVGRAGVVLLDRRDPVVELRRGRRPGCP